MQSFDITGMSCAACVARVEKSVNALDGVESCSVNLLTSSMNVEGSASKTDIINAVKKAGYGASLKNDTEGGSFKETDLFIDRESPILRRRFFISLSFLLALMYISMGAHMGLPQIPPLEKNPIALDFSQLLLCVIILVINQKNSCF